MALMNNYREFQTLYLQGQKPNLFFDGHLLLRVLLHVIQMLGSRSSFSNIISQARLGYVSITDNSKTWDRNYKGLFLVHTTYPLQFSWGLCAYYFHWDILAGKGSSTMLPQLFRQKKENVVCYTPVLKASIWKWHMTLLQITRPHVTSRRCRKVQSIMHAEIRRLRLSPEKQ